MKKKIRNIIKKAELLQIHRGDLIFINESLEHNEYGECIHAIVASICENNTIVDMDFYESIKESIEAMGESMDSIECLRDLIKY